MNLKIYTTITLQSCVIDKNEVSHAINYIKTNLI